jgi:hypothetical protein
MSDGESDVPLYPTSMRVAWFAVVASAGAAVLGATADTTSWPIRVVVVVTGVAIGFALGWKSNLQNVLASLTFVLVVSAAMLSGAITLWLGFSAVMSAATGSTVRQIVALRSSR